MYKSYALYLYYLRLLKEESFNPKVDLRVKLFCDWTETTSVNYERKSFWPWIYGLKKDQIISLVKYLNIKEDRISDHIKKGLYFITWQKDIPSWLWILSKPKKRIQRNKKWRIIKENSWNSIGISDRIQYQRWRFIIIL